VFEADLNDIRRAEPRIPARFRPGNEDDLMQLSQGTHDYDAAAREFGMERLQAGDSLTLAESGNEVVFYSWLMFGQLDMGMRRYLPIAADTACVYRLFTVAACRGRRLAPAWFWFIRERLRQRNLRRVVAWVEARNLASRRSFESAGFRRIGYIWHVQFLFRIYFFVSPSLSARLQRQATIESPAEPLQAAQ
jgi:GNAT superfamily N-acetyltransferase